MSAEGIKTPLNANRVSPGEKPTLSYGKHNVLSIILPTDDYIDPVETLGFIRRQLNELRPTSETLRSRKLSEHFDIPGNSTFSRKLDPLMELAGSWRHPDQDYRSGGKYINPNYVHLDSQSRLLVTNTDKQVRIARRLSRTGLITRDMLATRFGMTEDEFNDLLTTHNVDWETRINEANIRLANTWCTLEHWGYSTDKITKAFGTVTSDIEFLKNTRHASGFKPPEPPENMN